MKTNKSPLEKIPGIGPRGAEDMNSLGIREISDLKGKNPEKMYSDLEKKVGHHVDRCVLYTFREAVYFSEHKKHDPKLLKWWNWKDKKKAA